MTEHDPLLLLENQLCFHLYAASRAVVKQYGDVLPDYDLTYPQYLVMLVLWEHREQKVKDLCTLLYLETSTLTPLLKRLEKKGYITRRRSSTDERNIIISLSDKGAQLRSEAASIPARLMCKFGTVTLSEDQIAKMMDMLKTLLKEIGNPSKR